MKGARLRETEQKRHLPEREARLFEVPFREIAPHGVEQILERGALFLQAALQRARARPQVRGRCLERGRAALHLLQQKGTHAAGDALWGGGLAPEELLDVPVETGSERGIGSPPSAGPSSTRSERTRARRPFHDEPAEGRTC